MDMCVYVCTVVLNVDRGTGGNKEVRVLRWMCVFYLRTAIFNLSAVCFFFNCQG